MTHGHFLYTWCWCCNLKLCCSHDSKCGLQNLWKKYDISRMHCLVNSALLSLHHYLAIYEVCIWYLLWKIILASNAPCCPLASHCHYCLDPFTACHHARLFCCMVLVGGLDMICLVLSESFHVQQSTVCTAMQCSTTAASEMRCLIDLLCTAMEKQMVCLCSPMDNLCKETIIVLGACHHQDACCYWVVGWPWDGFHSLLVLITLTKIPMEKWSKRQSLQLGDLVPGYALHFTHQQLLVHLMLLVIMTSMVISWRSDQRLCLKNWSLDAVATTARSCTHHIFQGWCNQDCYCFLWWTLKKKQVTKKCRHCIQDIWQVHSLLDRNNSMDHYPSSQITTTI